jgi:hypothetical protein
MYNGEHMNNDIIDVTIYLAGPLDLGVDVQWKKLLQTELETLGVHAVLFNPGSAYLFSNYGPNLHSVHRAEYVKSVNMAALINADILVVSMPSKVQSIGTPIEMWIAQESGIRTLCLTDIPVGQSIYLDFILSRPESTRYIYDAKSLEHTIKIIAEDIYRFALNRQSSNGTLSI